jgi:hypothetical protein
MELDELKGLTIQGVTLSPLVCVMMLVVFVFIIVVILSNTLCNLFISSYIQFV